MVCSLLGVPLPKEGVAALQLADGLDVVIIGIDEVDVAPRQMEGISPTEYRERAE
ncbi:hypothetical protein EVA_17621 [gut metagenome]|uniref:Uncharacterized protein n=1 Tax=gut metagenome TaxID=749906 RepID=J9FIL0_9ZZZZ